MQGEVEAESVDEVFRRLYAEGYVPIRADVASRRTETRGKQHTGWRRKRVTLADVERFTMDLGGLIQAGFSTDRALHIQTETTENPVLRQLLARIKESVREGAALSKSLMVEEQVFSPLYLSMVHSGEISGDLGATLLRLGEFMQRAREIRETIVSSLIYPVILTVVATISLALVLGLVVPRFTEMFDAAGHSLPVPARIVIYISGLVQHYWWLILIALVALAWYMWRQLQVPENRLKWDVRLLRVPVLNELLYAIETARFSRTLGTLTAGGVPLVGGMNIAKEVIINRGIAGAVGRASERVRQGQGLARTLLDERAIPKRAGHMLHVAEESGRLADMLLRVADMYDREVQGRLRRMVTLIEPALILGMGIIIGGIIMSVVVAILEVNQLSGL